MERHQHAVVQILSHLGQVWVYASHKPELLRTSMMVFGRERPTFGDETISIASYCFQVFFSCQHRTTGVLCEFLLFLGFVWTFLCIKWVFNAFMCIIQIWTTCTCSGAYKLVEKWKMCHWLHAYIPCKKWEWMSKTLPPSLGRKHWDTWFLNSSKSKTFLKFMKLGMLSWSSINMPW